MPGWLRKNDQINFFEERPFADAKDHGLKFVVWGAHSKKNLVKSVGNSPPP